MQERELVGTENSRSEDCCCCWPLYGGSNAREGSVDNFVVAHPLESVACGALSERRAEQVVRCSLVAVGSNVSLAVPFSTDDIAPCGQTIQRLTASYGGENSAAASAVVATGGRAESEPYLLEGCGSAPRALQVPPCSACSDQQDKSKHNIPPQYFYLHQPPHIQQPYYVHNNNCFVPTAERRQSTGVVTTVNNCLPTAAAPSNLSEPPRSRREGSASSGETHSPSATCLEYNWIPQTVLATADPETVYTMSSSTTLGTQPSRSSPHGQLMATEVGSLIAVEESREGSGTAAATGSYCWRNEYDECADRPASDPTAAPLAAYGTTAEQHPRSSGCVAGHDFSTWGLSNTQYGTDGESTVLGHGSLLRGEATTIPEPHFPSAVQHPNGSGDSVCGRGDSDQAEQQIYGLSQPRQRLDSPTGFYPRAANDGSAAPDVGYRCSVCAQDSVDQAPGSRQFTDQEATDSCLFLHSVGVPRARVGSARLARNESPRAIRNSDNSTTVSRSGFQGEKLVNSRCCHFSGPHVTEAALERDARHDGSVPQSDVEVHGTSSKAIGRNSVTSLDGDPGNNISSDLRSGQWGDSNGGSLAQQVIRTEVNSGNHSPLHGPSAELPADCHSSSVCQPCEPLPSSAVASLAAGPESPEPLQPGESNCTVVDSANAISNKGTASRESSKLQPVPCAIYNEGGSLEDPSQLLRLIEEQVASLDYLRSDFKKILDRRVEVRKSESLAREVELLQASVQAERCARRKLKDEVRDLATAGSAQADQICRLKEELSAKQSLVARATEENEFAALELKAAEGRLAQMELSRTRLLEELKTVKQEYGELAADCRRLEALLQALEETNRQNYELCQDQTRCRERLAVANAELVRKLIEKDHQLRQTPTSTAASAAVKESNDATHIADTSGLSTKIENTTEAPRGSRTNRTGRRTAGADATATEDDAVAFASSKTEALLALETEQYSQNMDVGTKSMTPTATRRALVDIRSRFETQQAKLEEMESNWQTILDSIEELSRCRVFEFKDTSPELQLARSNATGSTVATLLLNMRCKLDTVSETIDASTQQLRPQLGREMPLAVSIVGTENSVGKDDNGTSFNAKVVRLNVLAMLKDLKSGISDPTGKGNIASSGGGASSLLAAHRALKAKIDNLEQRADELFGDTAALGNNVVVAKPLEYTDFTTEINRLRNCISMNTVNLRHHEEAFEQAEKQFQKRRAEMAEELRFYTAKTDAMQAEMAELRSKVAELDQENHRLEAALRASAAAKRRAAADRPGNDLTQPLQSGCRSRPCPTASTSASIGSSNSNSSGQEYFTSPCRQNARRSTSKHGPTAEIPRALSSSSPAGENVVVRRPKGRGGPKSNVAFVALPPLSSAAQAEPLSSKDTLCERTLLRLFGDTASFLLTNLDRGTRLLVSFEPGFELVYFALAAMVIAVLGYGLATGLKAP